LFCAAAGAASAKHPSSTSEIILFSIAPLYVAALPAPDRAHRARDARQEC
jgi:hypothetical protein